MASIDISGLGSLNSSEPLDLAMYKDASAGFQLPKAGRYTCRAKESFTSADFGATKAGFLSASVDPTIVDTDFVIKFTKVSAKPFQRGGQTVSQMGDYLRACGVRQAVGGDPQSLANAIAATANLTFDVEVDWRAYNKRTGFVLEGMTKFPKLADGTYQSWVEDPNDIGEDGQPVRLRANLNVVRYIPKS